MMKIVLPVMFGRALGASVTAAANHSDACDWDSSIRA